MASSVCLPSFYCSSAAACRRPAISTGPSTSNSATSCFNYCHKNITTRCSQLGQCDFTQWTSLRQMGISISLKPLKLGRKVRSRGMIVHASLFGVGAPEALVIGVVALLVFGPKGLAEVARNLGKTLRTFQPTIRELQDVSREFKTTLEREIGMDDIPSSSQNTYRTNRPDLVPDSSDSANEVSEIATDTNNTSPNKAYSSEDYLKITEAQLQAAAAQQQAEASPFEASQTDPKAQPQADARETNSTTASTAPPPQKLENES